MAGSVEQSSFISFVNELDYSSTFILRKHPRNEQVTSAEELGTMSKNNLREIILGIRPIWRIYSLTIYPFFVLEQIAAFTVCIIITISTSTNRFACLAVRFLWVSNVGFYFTFETYGVDWWRFEWRMPTLEHTFSHKIPDHLATKKCVELHQLC